MQRWKDKWGKSEAGKKIEERAQKKAEDRSKIRRNGNKGGKVTRQE